MPYEYKPEFYVSFNAEDNAYYFTGNANNENAVKEGEGVFFLPGKRAKITVEYEKYGGCEAVRQTTSLENTGNGPLSVEVLSSAFLSGVGYSENKPWKKHRFILHYAHSCWCGEAQWRHVFAEDAGLYKTYNHNSQSSFRMFSQSSWSTCYFEPVIMIEDTEAGKTWFAEIECGHGWCIDVCIKGYRNDTALSVLCSDCFIRNDGWCKTLMPGEKITSCPALTGCVDGGFEEAAAELTKARRRIFKTSFENNVPPLCYNDYMNALWALPTYEKTAPLIEAAAKVGCEYYIMDAGWYNVNGDEEKDLGMWEVNDKNFGESGLRGIFDLVVKSGMKPGIWFEFESVGAESKIAKKHPEYLLKRNGYDIGGRRCLLDFRAAGVREHIASRIKHLYDMGVRYIKNDYNANTGAGIDPAGAASVRDHSAAFEEFIDGIRARFPDLIIENCGSGAMRSDMGTLSHFHLQSVSDQEDYFRLPSIVSGSEACYPPERCGIWAYPYPVKIDCRQTFMPSPGFTEKFRDGKLTSYCMATGLLGLMYLSGRIDCADEYNLSLMKKAADIYKENRKYISASVPVYPAGTFDIDTDDVNCFGLIDRGNGMLMLSVWNNSDKAQDLTLDLSKYFKAGKIKDVFPGIDGYSAELSQNKLNVSLSSGKSALYTAITF